MLKPSEPATATYASRRPFPTLPATRDPGDMMEMTSMEAERWARVKQRLRAEEARQGELWHRLLRARVPRERSVEIASMLP